MHKILPPPRPVLQAKLLPVAVKMRGSYLIWYGYYQKLPKEHRYSLGKKIDTLMVEVIEAISQAGFLPREEKMPYVKIAIRKLDTAKVLLMVLWETRSIDSKKYAHLSAPLDEVGKMLGGWLGQLQKSLDKNKTPRA